MWSRLGKYSGLISRLWVIRDLHCCGKEQSWPHAAPWPGLSRGWNPLETAQAKAGHQFLIPPPWGGTLCSGAAGACKPRELLLYVRQLWTPGLFCPGCSAGWHAVFRHNAGSPAAHPPPHHCHELIRPPSQTAPGEPPMQQHRPRYKQVVFVIVGV